MRFSILTPDDARWTRLLEPCQAEFYHRPDYVRLEAVRQGGEAVAFWCEEQGREWLLPVVLRSLDAGAFSDRAVGWRDAVSPYGYPHPLTRTGADDDVGFIQTALAALPGFLREARVLTVFVRCSPLHPLAPAYAERGHLIEHGPCYWLDLTQSIEDLQHQMRSRYRSYLNALKRDGVEARWVPMAENLETFIKLYYQTMDRVGAAGWYYFDRAYFEELTRLLGEALWLCQVRLEGALLAAGLFASSGGITQYLLSGVDESLGQPHATKLMMVQARDRAKEAGDRALHLGGGLGAGNDMLSQFKRGFTRNSSRFFTWRLVSDEALYSELLRAWERNGGVPADGIDGFFPAYRKPLPSAGKPVAGA
jgi:hypothetical protein